MQTAENDEDGHRHSSRRRETTQQPRYSSHPLLDHHYDTSGSKRAETVPHPQSPGGGQNRGGSGRTNAIDTRNNKTKQRGRHHHTLPLRRQREPLDDRATRITRGGLFERGDTWSPTRPKAGPERNKLARASTTDIATAERRASDNPLLQQYNDLTWEPNPPGSRGIGAETTGRKGRGGGGGGIISTTEASRMLDELLDDQRELEAFLEEELARRGLDDRRQEALGERSRGSKQGVMAS